MIHVEAAVRWTGNYRFVQHIIDRAEPVEIEREVLMPWGQWVTKRRIPWMYGAGGMVPGPDGQPRWQGLSRWTKAQKGPAKNLLMISSKGTGYGTMPGSYDIARVRRGRGNWLLVLTNKMRSRSQYSPGFDYPSALHTGWGPYTVRPRADGPGALFIPLMGSIQAKTGKFRTGRAKKIKTGTRRIPVAGGSYKTKNLYRDEWTTGFMIRLETHPQGAPPRPHIRFFGMDVNELAKRTLDWCMEGIVTSWNGGKTRKVMPERRAA